MLYREPKLLKVDGREQRSELRLFVSVLYREPKLLKEAVREFELFDLLDVSVLYREPKLLKAIPQNLCAFKQLFQCSTVSRNC